MEKENLIKNLSLKKLTDNLGYLYESKDKFICLIDEEKIKNKNVISLNKMNDKKKKIIKRYHLDKKETVYIIDGIIFDDFVTINGYNGMKLYLKDCIFNGPFSIEIDGELILENNKFGTNSLCDITSNNILVNGILLCKNQKEDPVHLGIYAKENLIINDSIFGYSDEKLYLMLKANKKMELNKTYVNAEVVKIDANNLNTDDKTYIDASNRIILNTNEPFDINIRANEVVYNKEQYNTEDMKTFSNEKNMILKIDSDKHV